MGGLVLKEVRLPVMTIAEACYIWAYMKTNKQNNAHVDASSSGQ